MPLVALAPALIAAGGTIGSSLIASHGRGSSSSKTPLLPAGLDQNALLSSINTQRDLASMFQKQGTDFLGEGHDVLHGPLHYLQGILGGDRTAIMETMAPEVAAINAQFRAPLAQAAITGRGTSLQPDLEASRQSAISNQIFQARPAAADKLTGIAQGLMNLGFGSQQVGAGVSGQVSKEILDYNAIIRGIQAQQSAQSSGAWGALGSSLGPILAQVIGGLGGSKDGPNTPPLNIPLPPIGEPTYPSSTPGSSSYLDPALISSLIRYGEESPDFYSSWLPGGTQDG